MAIYPLAKYRPVKGLEKDPPIKPIGVILHVRAGVGRSLFDYFNGPSKGIESHFYITYDGYIEQYRDTTREADANYHGNSFQKSGERVGFISVETEGLEFGVWTPTQLKAIQKLILWLHITHNIPLQVCGSWTSPGIGYHTMWGAPGPWTPVNKTCPGPNRIKQFKHDLTAWLNSDPTIPEDDVNLSDKFAVYNPQDGSRPEITVQEALRRASYVYNYMPILRDMIKGLTQQNVALLQAMQNVNGVDPKIVQDAIAQGLSSLRIVSESDGSD